MCMFISVPDTPSNAIISLRRINAILVKLFYSLQLLCMAIISLNACSCDDDDDGCAKIVRYRVWMWKTKTTSTILYSIWLFCSCLSFACAALGMVSFFSHCHTILLMRVCMDVSFGGEMCEERSAQACSCTSEMCSVWPIGFWVISSSSSLPPSSKSSYRFRCCCHRLRISHIY